MQQDFGIQTRQIDGLEVQFLKISSRELVTAYQAIQGAVLKASNAASFNFNTDMGQACFAFALIEALGDKADKIKNLFFEHMIVPGYGINALAGYDKIMEANLDRDMLLFEAAIDVYLGKYFRGKQQQEPGAMPQPEIQPGSKTPITTAQVRRSSGASLKKD